MGTLWIMHCSTNSLFLCLLPYDLSNIFEKGCNSMFMILEINVSCRREGRLFSHMPFFYHVLQVPVLYLSRCSGFWVSVSVWFCYPFIFHKNNEETVSVYNIPSFTKIHNNLFWNLFQKWLNKVRRLVFLAMIPNLKSMNCFVLYSTRRNML